MALFVICKKFTTISTPMKYFWKLIEKKTENINDEKILFTSNQLFDSEKDTRSNISLIKKSIKRFTKIEIDL